MITIFNISHTVFSNYSISILPYKYDGQLYSFQYSNRYDFTEILYKLRLAAYVDFHNYSKLLDSFKLCVNMFTLSNQ